MTARRSFGIGQVLTLLIAATGLLIAAVVHLSWQRTADANIRDVASQLNRQIVGSIRQELAAALANAEAAREAIRSIFYQNVLDTTDEAKREFIFLALLQSQPALSWISFGWPNGDFFGAQKLGRDQIRMVEVRRDPETRVRQRRIDSYDVLEGDIEFKRREFADSSFSAIEQPWYRLATDDGRAAWTETSHFPTRVRPAVSTSTRLSVFRSFVGVISATIELERLSEFLGTVQVGRSGRAYVLAPDRRVLAAPPVPGARPIPEDELPAWHRLDAASDDAMLATAARALGAEPLGAIAGTRESDYVDPLTGRRYFVAFTPVGFEGWLVATVIPASDFLAEIDRATERLAWVLALLVLAAAAGSAWLANRLVARPIERIGGQLRHIEQFQLDRIEHVPSPLREIAGLSTTLVQMGRGLSSFRKFLPADLVRMLVSQGIEARPGGQRQNLTVMFADLAGFTRLSERLGDRIVPLLADYLGRMSREVANGGGTVDKFIGDAVMAFWGAPLANPAHAVDACRTALACQRMMTDLSSGGLGPHGSELSMRIGLNSGDVIVGNIGSDDRLNYTAVGDAVNLASRLESLNKRYGTGIIIGEATRRAAGDAIIVRHLDVVTVYGRSVGTPVYELLAMADEPVDLCIYAWRKTYERGLVAYRGRRWLEAIGFFEAVIAARGEDRPSMLFIERCQAFAMDPPPARWDAVTVLDAK